MGVPTRDYGYAHPGKGNTYILNELCVPTIYTLSVPTSINKKIAHKFVGSVYYRLIGARCSDDLAAVHYQKQNLHPHLYLISAD